MNDLLTIVTVLGVMVVVLILILFWILRTTLKVRGNVVSKTDKTQAAHRISEINAEVFVETYREKRRGKGVR